MQKHNINLLNDALFKALFRSKEARGMVASFLSSVTKIEKKILINALYIGGELPKEKINEKGKISDIIVRIDDNNRIIVEMNQYYHESIFEKNSEYAFSLINGLTKLNKYPKVILINIDNFNKYNAKCSILNFKIRDEEGHIESEIYNSIHIIIENVIKNDYNEDENVKKFCTFLKCQDIEKLKEEFKGDEEYMAGIVKVEDMMKNIDEVGLLYDKEEEYHKILEEEKEVALKKGIEQGIKQGSFKEKINSIKEMVSLNIPKEQICQITKISLDEYENIISNF